MQNGTCPMCRKNLHYKRMPIRKWAMEADETRKDQIFQKCFDDVLEVVMDDYWAMDELADIEKTYRALKFADCTAEEIDYVLNDTDDYYSDRDVHLMKRGNYSENSHVYPIRKFHQKMKFKNKAR